jgi:hypothetical protein
LERIFFSRIEYVYGEKVKAQPQRGLPQDVMALANHEEVDYVASRSEADT